MALLTATDDQHH